MRFLSWAREAQRLQGSDCRRIRIPCPACVWVTLDLQAPSHRLCSYRFEKGRARRPLASSRLLCGWGREHTVGKGERRVSCIAMATRRVSDLGDSGGRKEKAREGAPDSARGQRRGLDFRGGVREHRTIITVGSWWLRELLCLQVCMRSFPECVSGCLRLCMCVSVRTWARACGRECPCKMWVPACLPLCACTCVRP